MKPWMKRVLIVVAVLIVLAIGFWLWISRPDTAKLSVEAVSGRTPEIAPARNQAFPTTKIAEPTPWGANKPQTATGLQVAAFAEGLDHPRWLYRLPNGDVLVAETNSPPRKDPGITGMVMRWLMGRAGAGGASANRITLLRDGNGDGVAETRSVLLEGLNSPFGMVLMGDHLYVANTDAIVRFPFKPGETKITAKPEKVYDLAGGENHWTRGLIASADGKSLFVSVGSASNIAEKGLELEGLPYTGTSFDVSRNAKAASTARAAILEVYPDSKTARVYAWGLRNPVGMAIEPSRQSLWTVVNERDMLGSDTPPDYMTQVDMGAFYGWPWNYWGGHVDRRVTPERPDLREYSKRPDFALGPHTAPLGIAFSNDARLGQSFARGAFVALHGSWNRVPASGYKVVFVPFAENGFPVRDAKPVDVLTGFLNGEGKAQGRPVGLITDASGALLVADDVGNRIWRITAPGAPANPVPPPSLRPAAPAPATPSPKAN